MFVTFFILILIFLITLWQKKNKQKKDLHMNDAMYAWSCLEVAKYINYYFFFFQYNRSKKQIKHLLCLTSR